MKDHSLPVILRMGERALIVLGGIISIYLGYNLFVLGIDTAQGEAQAFGIVLRDFGPGLFFAALGAAILIAAMRATILTSPGSRGGTTEEVPSGEEAPSTVPEQGKIGTTAGPTVAPGAQFFFGVEDPERQLNKWSAHSFFIETRDLLRRLDQGEETESLEDLREGLEHKLESITMTEMEYKRYQSLTNTTDLKMEEQRELLDLENKIFP